MSMSLVLHGDARTELAQLDPESIHMCVTSPPYYGLRKYGSDPVVWGGNSECNHQWDAVHPPGYRGTDTKPGLLQHEGNKNREQLISQTCSKCNAWEGELGLEPTPEMYVQHLVEIFREVKRVLRDDGTLWVNIGDSYSGGNRKTQVPQTIAHGNKQDRPLDYSPSRNMGYHPTIKPKDILGIPWMLAFALCADGAASPQTMQVVEKIRYSLLSDYDSWKEVPQNTRKTIESLNEEWLKASKGGWYLRADLPWIKRNALPSSVTDRPSSSIEHVFLLSKSKKYYYDHIATMQPSSESYNKDKRPRGILRQCVNPHSKYPDEGQFKKQDGTGNPTITGFNARYEDPGTGLRFMRDSDFFFRTWQGLLHNEDGEPMALVVNPRSYKGAHFACFPVQLIEPMILAGTSEKGVCPECGAPWVRAVEKKSSSDHTGETSCQFETGSNANRLALLRQQARESGDEYSTSIETTGWQPSCACNAGEPVPATVLDPFAGSCAAGVACQWHNRDFIGIDIKPEYCELGQERLKENK